MGRAFDHAEYVFPRGYLGGLTLSTAGASTIFSVAAGEAVDSTQAALPTLITSISKTTSAWAVGSGNSALDTGTIAANTWYHVHLIKRTDTGVVDVLISLSATAPTLPTNYTVFRRIGSMKTNASSQWTAFIQLGDEFIFTVPFFDISSAAITSASRTLYALSVPTGIQVNALFRFQALSSSGALALAVTSPDEADVAAGYVAGAAGNSLRTPANVNDAVAQAFNVRTNTLGQIGVRASLTSGTINAMTYGYIDTRGKLT
jgi:hypothetical protein